jgi:alpha-acetolactate decarboxylase
MIRIIGAGRLQGQTRCGISHLIFEDLIDMIRKPRVPRSQAARWVAASALALSATAWAVAPRFDFAAFGSFKRMNHSGDTSGQVKLAALPQVAGSWGVGALAGLEGEVLLHDGRLLVSRGDDPRGAVSAPRAGEEAALFAAARVQRWAEVTVPSDMTQAQFEAFVLEQGRSIGLDGSAPFPFLLQGSYPKLTWHVVAGKPVAAAGDSVHSGHSNKRAGMRMFEQPHAGGQLVGVYSGAQLEGVVSHPGGRFHVHYADVALEVSGHVDAYAVASGSILKLPLQ